MNRFSKIQAGQTTLKNRLVVPPMASQTASTDGLATTTTIEHYANLANSGAGLVIVEYSYVMPSGKSEPNQLGAHDDKCIPGLQQIARAIHEKGAKAGFQLTHCGGKSQLDVCPDLEAPSGITVPAYDRVLPKPQAMTLDDMYAWRDAFVQGAIRAEKAGFDFVELHCAHGYGLNQVLSPVTNKRTDFYGGNLQDRARLMIEIVQTVKKETKLNIMVRVPGQDLYPDGLSQTDMAEVCRLLVEAGVGIIDVSSGIGGWNRPKDRRGEGYLVSESAYLKKANLGVPIIGVGGIETHGYIEQALQNQWFDLAAVGRAVLQGPQQFQQRVMKEPLPA